MSLEWFQGTCAPSNKLALPMNSKAECTWIKLPLETENISTP